ncbi:hypothetical protein PSTT_08195 [Puccinia striiformis]|uniref:Uncharacterized protein n=2 Tax=Puccinia striiformis TaxID=27350 RepID=A0A2S4VDK4_9BASI|nr:hypothetical protein PSTT_08195 [Puccinia striiformis]
MSIGRMGTLLKLAVFFLTKELSATSPGHPRIEDAAIYGLRQASQENDSEVLNLRLDHGMALSISPLSPNRPHFQSERNFSPYPPVQSSPVRSTLDLLGESDSHFKIRKEHLVRRLRNKYGDQYGLPSGNGHGSRKRPSQARPSDETEQHGEITQPVSRKQRLDLDLNLYLHAPESLEIREPISSQGSSPPAAREQASDAIRTTLPPEANRMIGTATNAQGSSNHLYSPDTSTIPKFLRPRGSSQATSRNSIGLSEITVSQASATEVSASSPPQDEDMPLESQETLVPPQEIFKQRAIRIKLAEATSPADQNVLREFSPKVEEAEIWGWICMFPNFVPKSFHGDLESQVEPVIPELTLTCLASINRSPSRNPAVGQSSDQAAHLQDRVRELINLLWILNFRVRKMLGARKTPTAYAHGQTKIMKWLIESALSSQHPSSSGIEAQRGNSNLITDRSPYRTILDAVQFDEDGYDFTVFSKKMTKTKPTLISKKQVFMSKSVVHILGSYYKNMNHEKWDYLFEDDIDFVRLIAHFGSRKAGQQSKKFRDGIQRSVIRGLFPWEATISQEAVGLGPHHFHGQLDGLQKWVKPIVRELSGMPVDGIPRFQIHKPFFLPYQEPEMWAWIANFKSKRNDKPPEEFKPSSKFIGTVWDFVEGVADKKLDGTEKTRFKSTHMSKVSAKVEILNDLLWTINGHLLEALGCGTREDRFFKEQKLVQQFWEFLFAAWKSKRSHSNGRLPVNDQGERTLAHNMDPNLEELVVNWIFSQRSKNVYKIRNSSQVKAAKAHRVITDEDIILTKIVVHMVGLYYKNQNYEKWITVFNDERTLFDLLIKLSSTSFYYRRPGTYEKNCLPNTKFVTLIPWSMGLDPLEDISSQTKRITTCHTKLRNVRKRIEEFVPE